MNLEAVAEYMVLKGLGSADPMTRSIFANEMPTECKVGILLLDRYSGTPINHYMPGWRDTGFRVAVRHADYNQGKALAWRVIDTMTIHAETQMGPELLVKNMLPMNEPRPYKRSVGGYWEFEVEVETRYVDQRTV